MSLLSMNSIYQLKSTEFSANVHKWIECWGSRIPKQVKFIIPITLVPVSLTLSTCLSVLLSISVHLSVYLSICLCLFTFLTSSRHWANFTQCGTKYLNGRKGSNSFKGEIIRNQRLNEAVQKLFLETWETADSPDSGTGSVWYT